MAKDRALLVTGASGNLGRRVVEILLARGCTRVIATTRSPAKLDDLARRGVDVRFADHNDPGSLGAAFTGADRMLLISSEAIGSRAQQVTQVVAAAEAAGVRHVCYTSVVSARPDRTDPVIDDHYWSELALASSRLSWTFLRHNMYAEHLFLTLPIAVASGVLTSPMQGGGRGYVTREDCAQADAGALAADDFERRILDVTGPSVVTHRELAQYASEATRRPVQYRAVSRETAAADWIAAGLRPIVAESLAKFDEVASHGLHAQCTPVVERLSGRPPEAVRDFILRNADRLLPHPDGRARIDEMLVVEPRLS